MDPQDGGHCQGERLWLWLWLALLLTSASVAVTGSNCTCQGPVQGSCGYQRNDSRDNLYNTRNVALGKPARASSLFNSTRFNAVSGPACLAVNGDRNTGFAPCNDFPHNPSCMHTAEDDREPYWEVDLCDLYNIASITVYWRDSEFQRNVDVKVTVDGELCYIFEHPLSNPSTITCYQRLSGQVVRLSKTDYTTRNNYYLTLCEVEVTEFSRETFNLRQLKQLQNLEVVMGKHIKSASDARCST
ncbi:uncharacterized protein LOC112572484 [Pomacea canaliculata]|uniref:uncharacterized protein LOC112572484 n=1 Tax=Pomacea canaliculata TaxID=400727 RepID=UPI000D73F21A|nr:uncharacterized protein LOC112572484 [Pomacea canaliculata]